MRHLKTLKQAHEWLFVRSQSIFPSDITFISERWCVLVREANARAERQALYDLIWKFIKTDDFLVSHHLFQNRGADFLSVRHMMDVIALKGGEVGLQFVHGMNSRAQGTLMHKGKIDVKRGSNIQTMEREISALNLPNADDLIRHVKNMAQHPGNHSILTKANVAALKVIDEFIISNAMTLSAKDYYALVAIGQGRIRKNQKVYMETGDRVWRDTALDVLNPTGGMRLPHNVSSVTNKAGVASDAELKASLKAHFEEVLKEGVLQEMRDYMSLRGL